ncbi:MAG TPA: PH domain-containing protein [Chitinophagaceae bacterium]
MKFRARMDKESIIITAVVFIIFFFSILIVLNSKKPSVIISYLIAAFLLIFVIVLITQKIKYFLVTTDSIQIVRTFYTIKFPFDKLSAIQSINFDSLEGSFRRMGINGIFGYSGTFSNSNYGVMRWFLTNKDQIIFLRLTNGENIFLSPENAGLFYSTVMDKINIIAV